VNPRAEKCLFPTYGSFIGILRLHSEIDVIADKEQRCDLITLSRGFADNKSEREPGIDGWNLEGRPKSTPLYEFHNVMSAEWKDGIAYR
jgi:hypothetical protein